MRMGVTLLLGVEAGAILDHQALGIDQPDAPARFGLAGALRHHGGRRQIGDAGRRFAGAEEQDGLILEFAAGHAQRREQAGERDRRRALDVVVEGRNLVAIFVQQMERRVVGEVLELDQHAREHLPRGGDELVDEVVIGLAGEPLLADADVIGVLEEGFVVGADVEHHRQAELGVNAGAGRVERQLADRNAHAVGAEIAEAEDAFAVGDDDQLRRHRASCAAPKRCGPCRWR